MLIDSGIGGLSIAQAIQLRLPCAKLTYIADTAAFPYGRLSEEELVSRILYLVEHTTKNQPFDAIVIACNTASTVVLEALRLFWHGHVVGVVPAIKTASEQSKNRCIGLLATEGTVKRKYLDDLIEKFASDCHVIRVGSPILAQIAENKIRGRHVDLLSIQKTVSPFLSEKQPDAVVLGCTHYPFLTEEIQLFMPVHISLIEPSDAIAKRLVSLLDYPEIITALPASHRFIHTGNDHVSELVPFLNRMHFDTINRWDV